MEKVEQAYDHRSFNRKINGFSSQFQLKDGAISISMKSLQKSQVLFAHYSQDNMPSKLLNVINSPLQLYQVLKNLKDQELNLNQNRQLVIHLQMFTFKRQYPLPLERADLSNQDRLLHQNQILKEQIEKLKVNILMLQSKKDPNLQLEKSLKEASVLLKNANQEKELLQKRLVDAKFDFKQEIEKTKEDLQSTQQKHIKRQILLQQQVNSLLKQINQLQQTHKKNIEQLIKDVQGQKLWNRSGFLAKKKSKSFIKWECSWDVSANYSNYFKISGSKVMRTSKQSYNYVQLPSYQAIPADKNVKINIKIGQYGNHGGIIIGLASSDRKNLKFSGGTQKGQKQDSVAYRTYQAKGQYKGRIYEFGIFNTIVPFIKQGQMLTIEVDRQGKQVFWSTIKQGLVHVSQLEKLSQKQLILFTTMYESGDSVEIC